MHIITSEALVAILREHIRRCGGSSIYAQRLGVSCAFVSAVLNGNKNASGRILQDLGYERVIAFRKRETPPAELAPGTSPPPANGEAPERGQATVD